MGRTIIKTGGVVKLLKREDMHELNLAYPYIYGDIHTVGNCAIIYYPPMQTHFREDYNTWAGELELPRIIPWMHRPTTPYHILIVHISCLTLFKEEIHYLDANLYASAGGVVIPRKIT